MDAAGWLDVFIGLLILARAVFGARNGFTVGTLGLIGLVAGAAAGFWAAPRVVGLFPILDSSRILRSTTIIMVVLGGIAIGEAIFGTLGHRLRGRDRAKGPDAFFGAIAAALVMSFVVWFVVTAVRPFVPPAIAGVISQSRVYLALDMAVPDRFNELPGRAVDVLQSELPQVFGGAEPELPAPEPDTDSLSRPEIQQAASSIVQVRTDAPTCRSDSAGSGWVVAPERVVTNAHVVAGSSWVGVSVGGRGPWQDTSVVAYDPDLDLAILAVPGLVAAALPRAPENLPLGADVVAAGFPWGGPYTLSQGRIRGTVIENGADIYGEQGITREVYSIRGQVRSGNSGGPLLTPDGRVAGTVFAMSALDPQTGYVLTDAATAPLLDAAGALSEPVPTGGCLVG